MVFWEIEEKGISKVTSGKQLWWQSWTNYVTSMGPKRHIPGEMCKSDLGLDPRVSQAVRYKHGFRFYLIAGGVFQREYA